MVDNFALGITHLLMALAAWRLLMRPDLDDEGKRTGVPPRGARTGPGRSDPEAPGDA